MNAYRPLHTHASLFNLLIKCYLSSDEIMLHRHFLGRLDLIPWLQIAVVTATDDPNTARFSLYKPTYPYPRLPARITLCTPSKLVLKGQMIYHHPHKPDKFILKLKHVKDHRQISWKGRLSISGYADITVFFLSSNNIIPENVYLPFQYGAKHIQVGDVMLYQPLSEDNVYGTFYGWHSSSASQIKLGVNNSTYFPSSKECLVVYTRPKEHRELQLSHTSSSHDRDSDVCTED